jgi:hypothetical protein
MALPLSSKQSALLLQSKTTRTNGQKIPPNQDNKDIRKVDERSYSPVQKQLKVQVQDMLEEDDLYRVKDHEEAKKLVSLQKQKWHEKEREQAEKQFHE